MLLKIDFKNAFNTIGRDKILQLVNSKIPGIYNFIFQCYAQESNLQFGSEVIASCEGIQQGDPLGPFLFSLGIQDIISSMKSELNVWYLDDGTSGGDAITVFEDAREIIKAAESHGVNPKKSELFLINPGGCNCSHKCESCGKSFPQAWNLKQHIHTVLEGQDCRAKKITNVIHVAIHFPKMMF